MKFYYFNSTHWDREWYQGFQEYRKYLVDCAEMLIGNFENAADYNKFTFDGQTVVLEDIREIRPDIDEKLAGYIKEKKLNIGPWYVMPDEFLVSGEAIIRNWQIAEKIAASYEVECWPVCYICDIFGHTSQMPQLIKKFGFKGGVFWRGIDSSVKPFCFWQSPDNSSVKMVRLSITDGYADFTLRVSNWTNTALTEEEIKNDFKQWMEKNKDFYGDVFILSDAFDHTMPFGDVALIFKCIKDLYPEAEVIHSDYCDVFENEFDKELQTVYNEQIYPGDSAKNAAWQINSTLSSRYDLKHSNDVLQNYFEKVIEPGLAILSFNGNVKTNYLLDHAWKCLIKNHAHDSICGCSIDAVHRAMLVRFEEIRQLHYVIAEELYSADYEKTIGRKLTDMRYYKRGVQEEIRDIEASDNGCYTIRMCNTLPHKVRKVFEFDMPFPASKKYPEIKSECGCYEYINSFRIYDKNKKEIPYQIRKIQRKQMKRLYRQDVRKYDIYSLMFEAELDACCWNEFYIEPSADNVRYFKSLFVSPSAMSNGKVRVDVKSDGSFDITDLRSKKVYKDQNNYFIEREIGDGWNRVRPSGNMTVCSSSCAQTRVSCDMPDYAEFEITRTYELPKELLWTGTLYEDFCGVEESRETVSLKIKSRVGIDAFSGNIHVHTVIDNNVCDCCLTLRVPTFVAGDYFANQMFYFISRKAGRNMGDLSEKFKEREYVRKNFNGIIGKADENGGIAFVSDAGLHEAGAYDNDEIHSLGVILFRSFRRTVMTNGEFDGELQKRMEFKYKLCCFSDNVDFAQLHREQLELQTDFLHCVVNSDVKKEYTDESFCKLSENMAFSSLKPSSDNAENCCILRFFNPSAREENAVIEFAEEVSAVKCMLNEQECGTDMLKGKKISMPLAPWEIATLKIYR